jgi:D-alanine-D-alanine ligase
MLARDKVLAKQLLVGAGVATPAFAVARRGKSFQRPPSLSFPLIVKSATDDASLGLARASVVNSDAQLRTRVKLMHRKHGCDALVESYIEGRELYVAVLDDQRAAEGARAFPVWELQFGRLPAGTPRIATRRIKWDRAYQRSLGIGPRRATGLGHRGQTLLRTTALAAYRALRLSGYARIDFRLRADGTLFVLEANPNPNLARVEDFASAAAAAGINYRQLLARIVRNASRRGRASQVC